jgi:hypothetical protein
MFLTSKLITCFIDSFTSKRKSQSIAYLLNGSEQIYWILDLENEVHSIWVIDIYLCIHHSFLSISHNSKQCKYLKRVCYFLNNVILSIKVRSPNFIWTWYTNKHAVFEKAIIPTPSLPNPHHSETVNCQ